MINLTSAPQSGRVLAYALDRLVYDAYTLQGDDVVLGNGAALDLAGIYEIHLFDAKTEFRATLANGEWSSAVAQAQEEVEDIDHFVFSETQFVKERFWVGEGEKIVVNNRFSFDDEGFLRLTGYRLAMEENL